MKLSTFCPGCQERLEYEEPKCPRCQPKPSAMETESPSRREIALRVYLHFSEKHVNAGGALGNGMIIDLAVAATDALLGELAKGKGDPF